MRRKRRLTRPRSSRREPSRTAGAVCAGLVVVGAWLIGWLMVPVAALIASLIWHDRPTVVREVTWGAVGGWLVLLLIDSLHGRTWALARAAGGAVFLPWGLLFPITLLFAAGLAWSVATLVHASGVSPRRVARRA
jgi:hypothetical protein